VIPHAVALTLRDCAFLAWVAAGRVMDQITFFIIMWKPCVIVNFGGLLLCILAQGVAMSAELKVQPERLSLTGENPQHGVLVTQLNDDGSRSDVTRLAKFASASETVVKVDAKGNCLAVGDGESSLKVTANGLETSIPVKVTKAAMIPLPSFKQDVLPILTKTGCNNGGCHGKLAGQNGFKLSLRGYAPEWDYEWLTQELNGRRVDFGFPAESLMLQKPSGALAHEGGVRFKPGSRMWTRLVDWIAARAPGPIMEEPNAVELTVRPGNRSMKVSPNNCSWRRRTLMAPSAT
jgi:hypothetical protein